MYVYPYGDSQQLNLDWIINKLKELEDREASAADLEEIANVFIALTHSSGTQYRRYDYCYYQGKLYRALNDNIGPFNASDWMEVRLGDDIPVLTRLINAIDAAAVVDVKFDTSGTNGKLQQKYNNNYHDVVEVDYTPVQNSKRPLSSNAGYELNGAITNLRASEVANDSNVTGTKVKDALNTLQAVTTGFWADFFSEADATVQGLQWIRQGKVVTVYILFVNEEHSTLTVQHPTIKSEFRPDLVSGNYIITPIYDANSPYGIAGSLWLYGDGSCYTYLLDLTKRPQYCSFTYITK